MKIDHAARESELVRVQSERALVAVGNGDIKIFGIATADILSIKIVHAHCIILVTLYLFDYYLANFWG